MTLFLCPRCERGKLYKSFLTMNDSCSECGLPFAQREAGDGPAFLVILIVGTLAGVLATVVELMYEPPYWVHGLIWPTFVLASSLLCLRMVKAAMVLVQYQYRKEDFGKD